MNQYSLFTPTPHVDFSVGIPDTAHLPAESIHQALQSIAWSPEMLQYGYASGYLDVRQSVAAFMLRQTGMVVSPDDLFMTTGISQALYVLCSVLAQPHDVVFVDELTYFIALTMFKERGLDVRVVCNETIDEQLRHTRPVFYYNVLYYNNPTGTCQSAAYYAKLSRLAAEHGFIIINDSIYHLLGFHTPVAYPRTDQHVHLYSCSKIVAPALKVGWIVGSAAIMHRLRRCALVRSGGSLNPLNFVLVQRLIDDRTMDDILRRWKSVLSSRMACMVNRLRRHGTTCPFSFEVPEGGYFIWVTFHSNGPSDFLSDAFFRTHSMFHRGDVFSATQQYMHCIRLCFAHYPESAIEQGIDQLFAVIQAHREAEIRRVLDVVPVVPFRGIESFYDVGGLLRHTSQCQVVVHRLVERYQRVDFDAIGCIDAHGWLFGPSLGMGLSKPVVLFRKNGPMPNDTLGRPASQAVAHESCGGDPMSVSNDGFDTPWKKVVMIDEVVATGDTMLSAIDWVSACGGKVVECACIVELSALGAASKIASKQSVLWSLIRV